MAEELFGGQDVGATPSYKEQAYRLIKEAILFNRFRVGAIYSQDDICKELGISRTPVREALLELQKDGYVSFSRGKGVQVVPVSDRDARDCELLLDHYLRFEVKSVYNNSIDAKIVFDEHVAICDAIAEGSAERAEQAMARHLTNSYRRTVSRFWAE